MELEERPYGTSSTTAHGHATQTPQANATNATGGRLAVTSSGYVRSVKRWWTRNISLELDHTSDGRSGGNPRDYFALERTYLGWARTSVTIVSFGIVITQLFILQSLDSTKGKVLGAVLACGGIVTSLLGCIRFLRQQRLLVEGKALSAGWHTTVLLALLLMILLTLFVIVLVQS